MLVLKELMLSDPRWTLAVAESLSSGHLQAAIGAISGASSFFAGGMTVYSLDQKVRQLGVDRAAAEPVNSVSAEVAVQMARGVARLFGTTLGAGTTGYAEASAANGVVQPFAWWALYHEGAGERGVRSGRLEFPVGSSRVEVQAGVAQAVLEQLITFVKELRG